MRRQAIARQKSHTPFFKRKRVRGTKKPLLRNRTRPIHKCLNNAMARRLELRHKLDTR